MTCDKKYNGWTNYQTWAVALWIDSGEGSYKYWNEVTRFALSRNPKNSDAILAVAKFMEEYFYEGNPLSAKASVYSDLLGSALAKVNWYEVAKSRFEN